MARYKFKGYTITNCGYHQPDHCVWWEAVNENGETCFHGNTLREVEFEILDYEWEQKMRKKEDEIELLKASKPRGNAAAMREALEQIHELLSIGGKPDTAMCIRYEAANQIARDALAKPPRNCDRFNSGYPAKDAADAYDAWLQHCDCSSMPPSCKGESSFRQWLFATATEQKGGNDGSK